MQNLVLTATFNDGSTVDDLVVVTINGRDFIHRDPAKRPPVDRAMMALELFGQDGIRLLEEHDAAKRAAAVGYSQSVGHCTVCGGDHGQHRIGCPRK